MTENVVTIANPLSRFGGEQRVARHRPWPRVVVDRHGWNQAAAQLVAGELCLLGLWGDVDSVHMALHDPREASFAVLSLRCPERRYPSIGLRHPAALRLERTLVDMYDLIPEGLPDSRPWLDHGRWPVSHPLAAAEPNAGGGRPYAFLANDGHSLHQIPVGPVHAGIIEPGHFRITANGEIVVRLEARLGYAHKGVERLMMGADLVHASKLAGRVSGDSTVAYALAFAQAVESASVAVVPARALWLRALMAELERIGNHFGDIGAVCNDAGFGLMQAHCAVLRERVLRASAITFGHRQMRDGVVPGGVAVDIDASGDAAVRALIAEVRLRFPALIELYDSTASLQDRMVGTGILDSGLARSFAAGGYVGRASGRNFDARRVPGYAPYDGLRFSVPVRQVGDVNDRVWIRIEEVEQSLGLIEQILDGLPVGPVRITVPAVAEVCEGIALVEGFRGDVLVWVRLAADGRVARCHLRDPSWFQWPLLEAAIDGNIVADFPLCNKSFNCSYSGHDL
ncbi:MAG: hydrogenase expression protein HypE [Lysobacterales bacterium CG02_land_8_20_14_3_00_62_12]|nr:MAG: hydrogenase expression protein HypE [Xanthomonadales bacterium CG02_land_8_20_14_3_00_62_12]